MKTVPLLFLYKPCNPPKRKLGHLVVVKHWAVGLWYPQEGSEFLLLSGDV